MIRRHHATEKARSSRGPWGALALLAWLALACTLACAPVGSAPRRSLGEPTPSASTSAEPQWLRSR